MQTNEKEVIVDDNEEEVVETKTGEETAKETEVEKPKRTPEEELSYFEGRAKRLRKDLGLEEEKPEPKKKAAQKSDELDYGQLAFYNTKADSIKIESEADVEFLKKTIADTGKSQKDLLGSKWFQAELTERRALSQTVAATPTGKRSSGVATDSVEYWMAKPFEEVPKDMRAKVVQAKLDKEQNKGHFYNS
jgi:hypothetical protein